MPHNQRTPRLLRRHIITPADLGRANRTVTRELETLGFWRPRLDDVEVLLVPASCSCYGWYQGDIHIPAVSGANLSDLLQGRHTRLTDVLRHEWAHAVADKWPRLVGVRRFERVFGGPYHSNEAAGWHDDDKHFTVYASTLPCEDFAETFHYFLRHKGRMPLKVARRPVLGGKWRFIDWMRREISS